MDTYEERKQAIRLFESGKKVSHIVRVFKKSRQWFYFWLHRYQSHEGCGEWYKGKSKAPKTKPSKISHNTEQQVVSARKMLEGQKLAQTGAIAIQYAMHHLGQTPPPVWTINRILTRSGLNKKPKVSNRKSDQDYPTLFFHSHQMDLVGPRYIKGDGRFYTVNIIDTECRSCFIRPVRTKTTAEVMDTLVSFWSSHGMPDALQMDNELAFRGSNRHPRSFNAVVRLALALNVAPVFIPLGEPWRNGIIEKFNNTLDKHFLRAIQFQNFDHLCLKAKEFTNFHNANHRYGVLKHKTPNEMRCSLPSLYRFDHSIDVNQKIPLVSGIVYFIRFIRGDSILKLQTESFKVNKDLRYTYVVAEVDIDNQSLVIRQNNEIVQVFQFQTPVDW